MATNPKIKKALLAKLSVTPQRLSQLVQKRKAELPMSTPEAIYTIAHEHGIDLSRELTPEETAGIRGLVAQLRTGAQTAPATSGNGGARTKRASAKKVVRVTIAGVDVGTIPGLSAAHATEAKLMSEKVYPTLYIFENSVRDIIERVLAAACGASWWTTAVPGTIQKTAAKHKADEAKDPWHGRRGQREIDYVFLNDLWAIIKHQWKYFKPLFPNQAWVESLVTSDMNVSRRVLAHMNPLSSDDVKNIEAAFRKWVKQLKAIEDKVP
jgi:Swt1-like HEPN